MHAPFRSHRRDECALPSRRVLMFTCSCTEAACGLFSPLSLLQYNSRLTGQMRKQGNACQRKHEDNNPGHGTWKPLVITIYTHRLQQKQIAETRIISLCRTKQEKASGCLNSVPIKFQYCTPSLFLTDLPIIVVFHLIWWVSWRPKIWCKLIG